MNVNEMLLYGVIGERLKQRRQEASLTQAQLAGAVGVLRTSITNIEAGRQKPPLHLLYGLCAALGAEISSILPTVEEVIEPTMEPFGIDMVDEKETPRLAEFLRSVRGE